MQDFLIALPVLLFSVVAHEYGHGYVALMQGDPTAQRTGRLTFNPLKHIDPWMSVLFPAILWFGSGGQFVFGAAKVANLVLFAICLALFVVVGLTGSAVPALRVPLGVIQQMLFWGIWLNVLLAFFNLIPIPPLDGSHLLYHALPPRLSQQFRALSRYGFLILLALIVFFRDVFFVLLFPALALTRAALSIVYPFALQRVPL